MAARVRDAGGQVLDGPLDVQEAGRWAMAKDPAGAMFGLWQAGGHIGSGLANEPGTFTWNENLSTDPRAVRAFYHQVFGYEYDEIPGMDYTVIKLHGAPVGGIGEQPPMIPPGTPSFWTTYFHVGDTDLTTAQIAELGGQILVPPTDSPTAGWRWPGTTAAPRSASSRRRAADQTSRRSRVSERSTGAVNSRRLV